MLQLRQYQQDAVDNTIAQLKKSPEPCLIDASVSAGKTFMVAGLMSWIEGNNRNSLCLTMTSELVEQNSDCYSEFVGKCSVFCSSLNKKNWRLPSVFATPQTLWAALKKGHPISKKKFSLLVVDESHNINFREKKTTYMRIINHYKEINPNLRIVGLTGTPFRGKGESIIGDGKFFQHKTADIGMSWLIENKFVVPPVYGRHKSEDYDFSSCKLQSNGKFNNSDLAEASEGKRLTHEIVQEVIANSQDRGGVLIFASTIAHCKEILGSLPPEDSCMITGETPDKERQSLIKKIKSGEIKYTVNLNVLTVGFSAPYIDHVVFMRPTESAVLWVQAVGRGVRMRDNKDNCLVSDYAGNLERLGDVDNPVITDMVKNRDRDIEKDVPCPECGEMNSVFARRCVGYVDGGVRCGFFFDFKPCPKCETQNDTTARNCRDCGHELIDPNKKLTRKSSFRIGVEPVSVPVINTEYTRHKKRGGGPDTLRVDYMVMLPNDKAEIISEWFSPDASGYPKHIFKREFVAKHAPSMIDYTLEEVLFNKNQIQSPSSLLINKMVGSKYLNIVLKEF